MTTDRKTCHWHNLPLDEHGNCHFGDPDWDLVDGEWIKRDLNETEAEYTRRIHQEAGVLDTGLIDISAPTHSTSSWPLNIKPHKLITDQGDEINHPTHYGGADDPHEPIKIIEAKDLGFHEGNALKYLMRAGRKPGESAVKDLQKAAWYLQRRIDQLDQPEPDPPFVRVTVFDSGKTKIVRVVRIPLEANGQFNIGWMQNMPVGEYILEAQIPLPDEMVEYTRTLVTVQDDSVAERLADVGSTHKVEPIDKADPG